MKGQGVARDRFQEPNERYKSIQENRSGHLRDDRISAAAENARDRHWIVRDPVKKQSG